MAAWRRKIWLISGSVLTLGIVGGLVAELGQYDSHRTNFRYLRWKYGHATNDYAWCLHLFMVDGSLRDSMKGKPMSELRTWLPDTGPAKLGTWQADWLETMKPEPHVTNEVIGHSGWAIRLVDGKFDYLFPMKG